MFEVIESKEESLIEDTDLSQYRTSKHGELTSPDVVNGDRSLQLGILDASRDPAPEVVPGADQSDRSGSAVLAVPQMSEVPEPLEYVEGAWRVIVVEEDQPVVVAGPREDLLHPH